VDRAALDFSFDYRCFHGGWCPKGRRAEDGVIPDRYHLIETESENYLRRTEHNVMLSDGTLILNMGELAGGTRETLRLAERHSKPVFVAALDGDWVEQLYAIRDWLERHLMARLNIAGPRESKYPGIYDVARGFLDTLTHLPYARYNAIKGAP
jgi:hypothetical protein